MIQCKCGCGTWIEPVSHYGRQRSYVYGHNMRGTRRPDRERDDARRTSKHETARIRMRNVVGCGLEHIGHCNGMTDVHHIDGNPWNNEIENLMKLCRTHHRLVDTGKINLIHPVMPQFYIDRSGKRRYQKSS